MKPLWLTVPRSLKSEELRTDYAPANPLEARRTLYCGLTILFAMANGNSDRARLESPDRLARYDEGRLNTLDDSNCSR